MYGVGLSLEAHARGLNLYNRVGGCVGRAQVHRLNGCSLYCPGLPLSPCPAAGIPTGGPPLPPTDLFSDDPDGGGDPQGGAAGLGLGFGLGPGAAAVAGTLGGRAGALWGKLRQLLVQVAAADAAAEQQLGAAEAGGAAAGGRRVGWLLRDAAAEAVLRTDPRINLPQWLLDMFLLVGVGVGLLGVRGGADGWARAAWWLGGRQTADGPVGRCGTELAAAQSAWNWRLEVHLCALSLPGICIETGPSLETRPTLHCATNPEPPADRSAHPPGFPFP